MSGSLIDLAALSVDPEDFLAGVLGAVAQPVWVVDREGVIRFANPAAIAALGYERADELLGQRSHETIHYQYPDGTPYPASECPMLLPRTTGETVASDLDWFWRRDGSMFPVSYVSVPLDMGDGRGAVVAFVDIEDRLAAEQVRREHEATLAAQQASLRRVATLVAAGATSADVFAAVAEEVGHVTGLPLVVVWRYEADGTMTVLGDWSERPHPFQVGTRWPLDGPTVCARVLETGRTARVDDFAGIPGTVGAAARETGIHACAGAPIIVDGEIWGAMSADSTDGEPLPDGIEDRLTEFTELVATAISNVHARSELEASRARIVAATYEERRRVVRDLHDGAQQRLVHTIVNLKLALQSLEPDQQPACELVAEALDNAERANVELRELARGMLPAALTHGGLRGGVDALASRMPVPVEVDVCADRFPPPVEATAYFVVAESLTNVAKHARATRAAVRAQPEGSALRLQVRDNGIGGARPGGSGLLGLADRVAALDGEFRVESPGEGGTVVTVAIPLPG